MRSIAPTRRTVLQAVGSALGGSALSAVAAGEAPYSSTPNTPTRYILDTTASDEPDSSSVGLNTVYRLDSVDLCVVSGPDSAVRQLGVPYITDIPIVHPSPVVRQQSVSDETESLYPYQWDKQAMEIPAVHETTRGEGTRIAIIDSGVQATHPNLATAVDTERSKNFTDDEFGAGAAYGGDHGTTVGGVIAADPATGRLVGIAPDTTLVDCRVFPIDRGALAADYLAAIVYAADIGCDVANLSLGPALATERQQLIFERFATSRVAQYANEAGMLLTVAAGNAAIDLRQFPTISFLNRQNVMVVSATGPIGFGRLVDSSGSVPDFDELLTLETPVTEPAGYSNYGADIITVSAPGGNYDSVARQTGTADWQYDMLPLCTTAVLQQSSGAFEFSNDYGWNMGTSQAAPQVAGVAVLLKSLDRSLTPVDIRQTIERTAIDLGTPGPDPFHGAGFLNPRGAVEAIAG